MRNRKSEIARQLRERITRGDFRPGARLPTRLELETEFSASSNTVQRALDQLAAERYIEARGRSGTFVTESPPHLSRICIFFEESFSRVAAENRLFRAIAGELENVSQRLAVRFEVIDEARQFRNAARLDALVTDVRARRLAGIFFLAVPVILQGTPLLTDPAIARVALASETTLIQPTLYPDYPDFYRQAIALLRHRGVRRPAFLVAFLTWAWRRSALESWILDAGWPLRRVDLQPILRQYPGMEGNLLELMFDRSPADRPDALVVADDNSLERISQELTRLGIRGTGDLELVALANFPYLPPSALPVTWIGFEPTRILETATRCILDQVAGRPVKSHILFPAQIREQTP